MKKLITIISLIAASGFDNVNADEDQQRLQAKIEALEEKIEELEEAEKEYCEPKRERLLSFGEQLTENAVQSNPLAMGRPGFYEQYSEPVATPRIKGISPEVARAIPFPRPPRRIEYMPIEQQRTWQRIYAETAEKQVAMQTKLDRLKSEPAPARNEQVQRPKYDPAYDEIKAKARNEVQQLTDDQIKARARNEEAYRKWRDDEIRASNEEAYRKLQRSRPHDAIGVIKTPYGTITARQ
jgi:hypothetical protein